MRQHCVQTVVTVLAVVRSHRYPPPARQGRWPIRGRFRAPVGVRRTCRVSATSVPSRLWNGLVNWLLGLGDFLFENPQVIGV